MIGNHIPALDELAFEGRNKEYGAYYLRKRYFRYLLISSVSGVAFLLLVVFLTWTYYMMDPVQLVEGDVIYEVEYYAMSPPPENDPDLIAQSMAKPIPESNEVPVVTDSVPPEKQLPMDPPVQKPEEEIPHTDSAATTEGSGKGTGIGDDTGLATAIDVFPRYPGGDESRLFYLRRHVKYPDAALKGQIQGVVMVVFVVEIDGSISNVNVLKKVGGGCDEEAMRVTREMPRWEPGKRNGRPVRVMVRMPIVFRIPGKPAI